MITIKNSDDITLLKEGGKRHAFILSQLAKMVDVGVGTFELNAKAMELLEEKGDKASFLNYTPEGARRPYPAALCVSLNNEIVHGIPNENKRILKDGDIVTLDLGLTHKGMITDSAITIGVGKLSPENKKLLEATKEALYAGIKAAKGGKHIGDIGYAVEQVAKRTGFAVAEGLAGHGVGYKVHEDPYVPNTGIKGVGEELEPGMVIAIEPMFCVGKGDIVLDKDGYTYKTKDGKNSAHFEHTILITKGDPIILTK
jgi:methionyl aminopeptidase